MLTLNMANHSQAARTSFSSGEENGGELRAPVAERHAVEHVLHGDRRIDEYGWLKHKDDPRVIAYLREENAYTDAILKPTEELQETLYQEMLGRILQTDLSVPYRLRGFSYYSRTEEGKQYLIHCRKVESSEPTVDSSQFGERQGQDEEVLLDLNVLAEGHSFLGLGIFEVSDDNRLLAFATDTTGFQQYDL